MESFLFQASLYLGIAILIVPLAVRLGLGSVLGYLLAGVLMGPVLGLAGAETEDLQQLAEIGVVMMLFLIGLELDPSSLWDMRHRLIGLGGAQVVITSLAVAAALVLAGLDWQVALTLGMILSLSSTAIVLQTLTERSLLRSPGGRSVFAVLLTQDVAVIPMLAILPLVAQSTVAAALHGQPLDEGAAEPLIRLVQSLPGWGAALLTLAAITGIIAAGHFLARPAFRFVHATRLAELSTFISLFVISGIGFLMMLVGLSPALGAFLAGVVLANSEFRHQIEADLRPFKGLFLGLFFMTVGIGIDIKLLQANALLVGALTLALILLKALVLLGIALVSRLPGKDRLLFTFALAQGGEFGFVLIAFAGSIGVLPHGQAQIAVLVISLSMLFTPALFLAAEALARRWTRGQPERTPDAVEEKGRVIIAGTGRFGQVVNRLVRMSGIDTVVLDGDLATIETMRRFGIKGYFGDPSRPELLEAAGLAEASVLVVAVDNRDAANRIVLHARRLRPDIHIVARARDRVHVYELFRAGADDIVRETFDSSIRAGRYVLENMGFSEYEAARVSQAYYRVDRRAMRDLAELWVPGQPVHLNAAYVERARKLDRDLELALSEEAEARDRPESAAE